MTADTNLERRIAEYYAGEPPLRAPDRVLLDALATIDTTRQRRGLPVPWRFLDMNTYTKLAAAAVVVVALGAVAFLALPKGQLPGAGGSPLPSVAPTPTAAPSVAPTSEPTGAIYVPPPLTETFTSDLFGLSISYPDGWSSRPATTIWTTSGGPFAFGDPASDFLFDPAREESATLFIGVASQPLGDLSFEAWSTSGVLADEGCGADGEPVVIDKADGISCGNLALVSSGGRGYVIKLYTGDDPDLRAFDDHQWFEQILATVQLQPGEAVDETP